MCMNHFQAPGIAFKNSRFCPHSVFTCSAGISGQTATVFLHRLVSLRWRVFTARYELNLLIYFRLISIFKQLRLGFNLRPVHVRPVLDKVTVEQVFLQVLRFSLCLRFHHFTIAPLHFTTSPLHHFTTSPFHHFTISSFQHFTISPLQHFITSQFHHFTILSLTTCCSYQTDNRAKPEALLQNNNNNNKEKEEKSKQGSLGN